MRREHVHTTLPLLGWLEHRGWRRDCARLEWRLACGRRCDIAYFADGWFADPALRLIVECKAPGAAYDHAQLMEYLVRSGCELGLWTDGRRFAVLWRPRGSDIHRLARLPPPGLDEAALMDSEVDPAADLGFVLLGAA